MTRVTPNLTEAEFWRIIEQVPAAKRVEGAMAEELAAILARRPLSKVAGFHALVVQKSEEALTWRHWEAAELIHRNSCSQDSFLYFRLWLVSRGQATFDAAVRDPDSLAGNEWIRMLTEKPASAKWLDSDYPSLEELMYASEMAFERILAKLPPATAATVEFPDVLDSRPRETPYQAAPEDFGSDSRVRRAYPRLWELFHPA